MTIRGEVENFEITIMLIQNLLRATIALLISQFLMQRWLKLASVAAHYLFSLYTLYCVALTNDLVERVTTHCRVDAIQLAVTVAFIDFLVYKIFDTS